MTASQPDYRHLVDAARNRKPARLPLYEHLINPEFMEKLLDRPFAGQLQGDHADRSAYFATYCDFYQDLGYDTVSYEVCVTEILSGGGALLGERDGVIRDRASFDAYPWDEVPARFWDLAAPRLDALGAAMPPGMKAVGGVGNGVFEISEDLVGYEQLCYMLADDPDLFGALYRRIGDLLVNLWGAFLPRYGELFAVCRMGDDLGFKTATLLAPDTLIAHVIAQYRRIIEVIHQSGRPYLQHSCGRIFPVMEAWVGAGIDAKHSNEDAIAPFEEWITRYGDRIGLFGGVDTDRLCRMPPDEVYTFVREQGRRFRDRAKGFALGSGNSIPEYVPVEGFLAMNRAARDLRRLEAH